MSRPYDDDDDTKNGAVVFDRSDDDSQGQKTESRRSVGGGKPFMKLLPKTKRRRLEKSTAGSRLREHFAADASEHHQQDTDNTIQQQRNGDEPMTIPAIENHVKWKRTEAVSLQPSQPPPPDVTDSETATAVRALQEEASNGHTTSSTHSTTRNLVIAKTSNTFAGSASAAQDATVVVKEQKQYQQDIEVLPQELDEHDTAYQQVPIEEFGAALLRGMGWKEDNNNNDRKKNDDGAAALPRPHRLGLGAIPAAAALPDSEGDGQQQQRRIRRPDQFQRDLKIQQQHETYRREREKQLAVDKQRTMQNGSLVWIHRIVEATTPDDNNNNIASSGRDAQDFGQRQQRTRARIIKLVGVPGLNMVQVQCEGEVSTDVVIKRNQIERLLTRQELDDTPFREAPVVVQQNTPNQENLLLPKQEKQSMDHKNRGDREKKRKHDDSTQSRSSVAKESRSSSGSKKKDSSREEKRILTWVIPRIRVRVVTNKLGRQFYRQKGVVVDVTPAGATLQMNTASGGSTSAGTVLDHVPERYIETALPKAGGNVIVLVETKTTTKTSSSLVVAAHKFSKGRLLERNSRYGVVQLFEDMHVVHVPLDDLAEWCGPLDDDEGYED